MYDEELINSGFNPGIRAMILVTVIIALAMALSQGIPLTRHENNTASRDKKLDG